MTPAWTFLSVFIGVAIVLLLPGRFAGFSRSVSLVSAAVGAVAAGCAWMSLLAGRDPWELDRPWIPILGARFHLVADGLSLCLLVITGIVSVAGILFSWNIMERQRAFFASYLTIIGGVYGVFLSRDALLLFVFYELVIIPKYLLIAVWGSKNREYGAMKLTMYSIGASSLILVGLVVAYAASGGTSFDLLHLSHSVYSASLQAWAFPILFLGFAVLAGMWPFHTWAPTGHVAAPTAASMLLAGVVMKLGAYGALCVAMPIFPQGYELWKPVIAVLAVVGILYGALVALVQKDLKFVIGYSSVSHMGLILLGLAAGNQWALRGAVLQMISHGIIAGLLFGIAGRVIYERTHSRDLGSLRSFDLWHSLPGAALGFTLATAASMGISGFSGFVAEITVILGVWSVYPWAILGVVAGIVLTGAFSLRALQKTFFAATRSAHENEKVVVSLPPLTWAEISAMAMLICATLAIGLYPKPWVVLIDDGLRSPLFQSFLSKP